MKKKILVIVAFLMVPIVTFGMTCDPKKDDNPSNNKTITCDSEKSTVTQYSSGDITVVNNSVCRIVCSEDLMLAVDPEKHVLAGTSFSYPLYVSGQRKCKATYKKGSRGDISYETNIRNYIAQGNRPAALNLYNEKKACDNFTVNKAYELNNALVSLNIVTSKGNITKPYKYVNMMDVNETPVVIKDEIAYDACNYIPDSSVGSCNENGPEKSLVGWTEIVSARGKYTMEDTYLKDFTGEVETEADTAYKNCNAGDRFFTDLNEITNKDPGYKLTLTARNLGSNIPGVSKQWNLTTNCKYEVENLVFPQENVIGRCVDENCEKYGTMGFQYRIIDLFDPFPGRTPGANWQNKLSVITRTRNNITSLEKFIINLNRSSILRTREYNKTHKYDVFDFENMEISSFINSNSSIVTRK